MKKNSLPLLLTASAFGALLLTPAHAVDYYLHAGQTSSTPSPRWERPGDWYDDPATGTALTTFDTAGTYHTNGFELRANASADTFDGAALVIDGTGGKLGIQGTGNTTTIASLTTIGGEIANVTNSASTILTATSFNNSGGVIFSGATSNSRTITLANSTLSGSGDITLRNSTGASNFTLGFDTVNASAFTGSIFIDSTGERLVFNNAMSWSGGLSVTNSQTGSVTLNASISLASLSVGTHTFTDGDTYSIAEINSLSGFDYFTGTGDVIISAIPEPSTYATLLGLFAAAGAFCKRRADTHRSA